MIAKLLLLSNKQQQKKNEKAPQAPNALLYFNLWLFIVTEVDTTALFVA